LVFEVDLEKTLTQELDAICTEEDAEVFIAAMERVVETAKSKRGTYGD
jgi:hypothetical protein